jgi:hypothetical protein
VEISGQILYYRHTNISVRMAGLRDTSQGLFPHSWQGASSVQSFHVFRQSLQFNSACVVTLAGVFVGTYTAITWPLPIGNSPILVRPITDSPPTHCLMQGMLKSANTPPELLTLKMATARFTKMLPNPQNSTWPASMKFPSRKPED